jgi:hypothetical protein
MMPAPAHLINRPLFGLDAVVDQFRPWLSFGFAGY